MGGATTHHTPQYQKLKLEQGGPSGVRIVRIPAALTEGVFLTLIFPPPSDFASDRIFLRDENGERISNRQECASSLWLGLR